MKKFSKLIGTIILVFTFNNTMCFGVGLNDYLNAAFMPVGKCLYVYGGGWNEEDTAAGDSAKMVGLSKQWSEFYMQNTSSYDHKKYRYSINDGLDCTGYIGWTMYQLFQDKYSDNGYVIKSNNMALKYSHMFGGTYIDKQSVKDYQCGDIMSCNGHAYIVVGACDDGSVVLLHSSPPNVSLCGTYTISGNANSRAVAIAKTYMSKYFKQCYMKYPDCSRNSSYLTNYNQMRWNEDVIADTDGYRNMSADDILFDYFENIKIYINNVRLHFDSDILMISEKVHVPVRTLAESLGAQVEWEAHNKTAKLMMNNKILKVKYSDNGAFIKNDRIYLPIRDVCKFFDCDIKWYGESKSVYIKTN